MQWLDEALIFLAAAAFVVPLMKRLGFGSVIGYLAAGVAIGPAGLGAIGNVEAVLHFAEIGVVFLLFVIGLELHPARLWVMRRLVFGLGTLQVVVTGLVLALAAYALGLGGGAALAIGFGLALSSTAFVLQMLAERRELGRPHGRAAFGVLLFQDIAIVPLIAALPVLAGVELATAVGPGAWLALGRDAAVLAAFIVGGHYLLRPVLRLLANTDVEEIFTAAALLLVIGSALLMESLGLSMGLGAFLAGVLVADSEYRHQLQVDIQPFKGLLLGLFFMAVGMSTELGLLAAAPLETLGIVAGLMTVKALVLLVLARAMGVGARSAATLALVLAQGGEFGFVLFNLASAQGLLDDAMVARLNLVITLSMAATPFLYLLDRRLGRSDEPARPYDVVEDTDPRVIIAGFGRFGQIVARILNLSGIPFTALEINPNLVDFVKRYGNKIYYGDARRLDLLRSAGTDRARLFVLAVDDVEASMKIAETVARHFPHVALYARARDRQHAMRLRGLGARGIIRDTLLSSISLASDVLKGLGFSGAEAERAANLFTEHDAKLLDRQYAFRDDEEALIQSSKDSAAQLKSLFESDATSSKEYRVDHNS